MGFEWKEVRWGGSEEVRDSWSNAGAGQAREIMEESGRSLRGRIDRAALVHEVMGGSVLAPLPSPHSPRPPFLSPNPAPRAPPQGGPGGGGGRRSRPQNFGEGGGLPGTRGLANGAGW